MRRVVGLSIPVILVHAVVAAAVTVVPAHAGTVGGCGLFPADSFWYADVTDLPVHARSAQWLASVGTARTMHADFGSGLWDGGPIGIPFVTVGAAQPDVPISFEYDDESDPGPYPIPPNAPIEGGAASTGDRHILVVDTSVCRLYEVFAAYPAGGGFTAGSGAVWDLRSNSMRPAGWTSADAAGLPILPALVRYDEVAAGSIDHALRVTVPRTQRSYVWPGRHQAGSTTDPNVPPMGAWVRLRADFDTSGFPPQSRVVLEALKTHGAIVADNGSAWYVTGAPDERWDNDDLHSLGAVRGSDFEFVDASGLMVHPDSGQALASAGPPVESPCPTVAGIDGTDVIVPLDPSRVLDTRTGVSFLGRFSAGTAIDLRVAGCAGLPAGSTGAVAMNVTSTEASTASYISVWPTGRARPTASSLNTEPGQDTPNLVIAEIGTDGRVSVYNNAGTGHLVADVVGWLPAGAGYHGITPARLLDTRTGVGAPTGPLGPGGSIDLVVTGRGDVPVAGVDAAVLNVTSTEASTPSFITVWPTGLGRPTASSLNTEPGQDTPNLVIARLGTGGRVSLYNNAGTGHLIADVVGWFEAGRGYESVTPVRLLDTRSGLGAPTQVLGPAGQVNLQVMGGAGVPANATTAVLNVTSTQSSAPSFITVWPTGSTRPVASSLNTEPGQDTPNLVIARLGANGQISLYNNAGTGHLIADLVGYVTPTS